MSRDIYKQIHYIYAPSLGINMNEEASPAGTVHISSGSAGSISSFSNYDDLIVESSGYTGISILCGDSSYAALAFRTPSDNFGARFQYSYASGSPILNIGTSSSGGVVKLSSGAADVALTIASDKKIGIGTQSPERLVHIHHEDSNDSTLAISQSTSGTSGPDIFFLKSDAGTAVPIDSYLGNVTFRGHDGTDWDNNSAIIRARADAAFANNDVPARLEFCTTEDGDNSVTVRMTIKNDGKVGIGTTSPLGLLHVSGPVDFPGIYIDNASASEGDIAWGATAAFTLGEWDGSTLTARMHIDSDGEVGIGTISPGALLHCEKTTEQLRLGYSSSVYSSFTVDSSNNLSITSNQDSTDYLNLYMDRNRISDSGTGDGWLLLGAAGEDGYICDGDGQYRIRFHKGSSSTGDLYLYDDAENIRLTINKTDVSGSEVAGGIGIGTNSPEHVLHVVGTETSDYIVKIDNQSSGTNADVLVLRTGSDSEASVGATNNFIQFQDGDGDSMGAIEGSSGSNVPLWGGTESTGNVILAGNNADYGEWLPVSNINDWPGAKEVSDKRLVGIEEGTVVFVKTGLINPAPPGLPMVVTERAIITGNSPSGKNYSGQPGAVLSFIGQVFVKISGDAKEGDFLIPSEDYGTCRSVSKDSVTFEDYIKSIGIALEDSLGGYEVSKIRCAIGVKSKYI